jgi:anti-sigma regulatory factor (Ser/Thr protein kinase)
MDRMGYVAACRGRKGDMDVLRLSFSHDAHSAAALRRTAGTVLTDWQSAELVDDALVVIAELVHNVIQHTGDGGELALSRRDDAVRIEVSDGSDRLPYVYSPDPRRVGGRGLLLVAALARAWGTHRLDAGKIVWAELPLPQSPSRPRR